MPFRILAISFKTDAADNLAARVRKRCPPELANRFTSLTFDAFTKILVDRFQPAIPADWRPTRPYDIAFPTYRQVTGFLQERRSAVGDDKVRVYRCGRRRPAAVAEVRHPREQRIWGLFRRRYLASLRRPRNQQTPSCESLRKGAARIAADVGAAPRHQGDRRTALVAVRALCRLLDPILKSRLAVAISSRCLPSRATISAYRNI